MRKTLATFGATVALGGALVAMPTAASADTTPQPPLATPAATAQASCLLGIPILGGCTDGEGSVGLPVLTDLLNGVSPGLLDQLLGPDALDLANLQGLLSVLDPLLGTVGLPTDPTDIDQLLAIVTNLQGLLSNLQSLPAGLAPTVSDVVTTLQNLLGGVTDDVPLDGLDGVVGTLTGTVNGLLSTAGLAPLPGPPGADGGNGGNGGDGAGGSGQPGPQGPAGQPGVTRNIWVTAGGATKTVTQTKLVNRPDGRLTLIRHRLVIRHNRHGNHGVVTAYCPRGTRGCLGVIAHQKAVVMRPGHRLRVNLRFTKRLTKRAQRHHRIGILLHDTRGQRVRSLRVRGARKAHKARR